MCNLTSQLQITVIFVIMTFGYLDLIWLNHGEAIRSFVSETLVTGTKRPPNYYF